MSEESYFKIVEEDLDLYPSEEETTFKITITGKGLKKYKQIKRMLDLLRMKWFK